MVSPLGVGDSLRSKGVSSQTLTPAHAGRRRCLVMQSTGNDGRVSYHPRWQVGRRRWGSWLARALGSAAERVATPPRDVSRHLVLRYVARPHLPFLRLHSPSQPLHSTAAGALGDGPRGGSRSIESSACNHARDTRQTASSSMYLSPCAVGPLCRPDDLQTAANSVQFPFGPLRGVRARERTGGDQGGCTRSGGASAPVLKGASGLCRMVLCDVRETRDVKTRSFEPFDTSLRVELRHRRRPAAFTQRRR